MQMCPSSCHKDFLADSSTQQDAGPSWKAACFEVIHLAWLLRSCRSALLWSASPLTTGVMAGPCFVSREPCQPPRLESKKLQKDRVNLEVSTIIEIIADFYFSLPPSRGCRDRTQGLLHAQRTFYLRATPQPLVLSRVSFL
jgi:hypothetical protein